MAAAEHEPVVEALQSPDWQAAVLELARCAKDGPENARVLRRIAKDIRAALVAHHIAPALRSAFAGIALARRKGHIVADALRPCTYSDGTERRIRRLLLELKALVSATPELRTHVGAIDSWTAFSGLVALAREAESEVATIVARSPMRTLHAVLGTVDEDFSTGRQPSLVTLAPSLFEELGAEQAASGASQIVEMLARMGRLSTSDGERRERQPVTSETAKSLIHAAYWLRELREYEILVYRLGFKCTEVGPSTFRIEAPADHVGYALSYGYFQASNIPGLRARPHLQERLHLWARADEFVAATRDASPFVVLPHGGRPHFGYRIRQGHAAAAARIVNREAPFREEEMELRVASEQLKVRPADLLDLEVADGVKTRDVLRLQRLLRFLALARSAELDRSELAVDSRRDARVLFLRKESFLQMATSLGLERPLAESLVIRFSWEAANSSHLDLQHTPILALQGHVLVPLSIAAESNLIRNGLWSSGRRPYPDGKTDPLVDDLCRAFEIAGIPAWANLKYEWLGKTFEIDVLALVGTRLVIFEAKNTLLPCSSFELRTTWDCLESAGEQLDRHVTALADPAVRARLSKRVGASVDTSRLATCIVVGHPLFSGVRVCGHPVRQSDVVCNFVASGEGSAWLGEVRIPTRLRPEGVVQEADILEFLDDGTRVYRDVWASGRKRVRPITIGKAEIHVVEYAFNPIVQLARSGLCKGIHQEMLDAAIARIDALPVDTSPDRADAVWKDAMAVYDAAVSSLDGVKRGS